VVSNWYWSLLKHVPAGKVYVPGHSLRVCLRVSTSHGDMEHCHFENPAAYLESK